MSGKKQGWFGRKKVSMKETTPAAPRTLAEINKDYSDALGKAGQSQYLIYVYTKELEQANSRLLSLNQEASARQTLDAKAAAAQPAPTAEPTGVSNEQV